MTPSNEYVTYLSNAVIFPVYISCSFVIVEIMPEWLTKCKLRKMLYRVFCNMLIG